MNGNEPGSSSVGGTANDRAEKKSGRSSPDVVLRGFEVEEFIARALSRIAIVEWIRETEVHLVWLDADLHKAADSLGRPELSPQDVVVST